MVTARAKCKDSWVRSSLMLACLLGGGGRVWGSWQRLMFEMASGHLALSLVRHNQLLLHVRFFGEKLSCVDWLCFILSISI